jgi:hypothetical protein
MATPSCKYLDQKTSKTTVKGAIVEVVKIFSMYLAGIYLLKVF